VRASEIRAVLERLTPPLYRYCLHLTRDQHLAEDLAQDTMLKAWKHRAKLRDEHGATPWLLSIANNTWRDARRRARVRRPDARHLPPQTQTLADDPGEQSRRALDLMNQLPDRQRDVLYLSAVEGLSNPQIARALEISAGAVKAALSIARRRVADALRGSVQPAGGVGGSRGVQP